MRPSDNPFRSTQIDALPYRYIRGDADVLWSRLEQAGHRGAIVGPMGTGKTTLLDGLAQRYRGIGRPVLRFRIPYGAGQPPAELLRARRLAAGEHVLLIDGLEQLGRLGWWRLRLALPAACGVVATMHSAGRLPTVWRTETTPELLRTLTHQLLPTDLALPPGMLEQLYRDQNGDIRQCLRALYDYCAALP